jgi:hypothetical protein
LVGKKESYKLGLTRFLDDFLKTGDEQKLTEYLTSNSNLPSPRGNLELATAFVEIAEDYSLEHSEKIWNLCQKLASISSDVAPTNNPREFLTFCGTYGLGAIASVSIEYFEEALTLLRDSANDSRWRIREAVAMGLQKLLTKQSKNTLKALEIWIADAEWLAMRAVAAGIADPPLLKNDETARRALELHKKIFCKIHSSKERKSDEFKTLRKGLGYTLSVVVRAVPKEGFEFMQPLASLHDTDILWIIKQNLKKKRLIKNFPIHVASIKDLLSSKVK